MCGIIIIVLLLYAEYCVYASESPHVVLNITMHANIQDMYIHVHVHVDSVCTCTPAHTQNF